MKHALFCRFSQGVSRGFSTSFLLTGFFLAFVQVCHAEAAVRGAADHVRTLMSGGVNSRLQIRETDDVVCGWESPDGFAYRTNGYTWGGGSFSTLEECVVAVKSVLLAIDFGQKRADGEIHFKAPDDTSSAKAPSDAMATRCQIKSVRFPYSALPQDFIEEMQRGSTYQSSPAKMMRFQSFFDENLEVVCG